MSAPAFNFAFPHNWAAEILPARPLILPPRSFVYPQQVEEVERGALEIMIHPNRNDGCPIHPAASSPDEWDTKIPAQPFLATCALGFRDPIVPTGIWSCPNPDELCALSGGYAYIVNTTAPEQFTMLHYRPVLQVIAAPAANLLLFVSHRNILAWGPIGHAWESPKLSDEGVTIANIADATLHGLGWNMITDKETPFALDLSTGGLR